MARLTIPDSEKILAPSAPQERGSVVRLDPAGDDGYLATEDGREVYFHRDVVGDDFDRLTLGTPVSFTEELGEDGPQASWVVVAG